MAHIGFDLDGTIYPFVEDVDAYLTSLGHQRDDRHGLWDVWDHYELTQTEFWRLVVQGVNKGEILRHGEPHFGAMDILTRLVMDDHQLYVVTARGNMGLAAKRATYLWLEQYLPIPWSGILISNNKAILPFKYFVDDHDRNLKTVEEAGIIPICYDQEWNQDWEGEHRCKNLWEVYETITALEDD